MEDITVQELKERMDVGNAPRVIDVREPHEWDAQHITEENWPMATVPLRLAELEDFKGKELVICCRSGGRSGQITMFLRQNGFTKVRNLLGGMLDWKEAIDPTFDVT